MHPNIAWILVFFEFAIFLNKKTRNIIYNFILNWQSFFFRGALTSKHISTESHTARVLFFWLGTIAFYQIAFTQLFSARKARLKTKPWTA